MPAKSSNMQALAHVREPSPQSLPPTTIKAKPVSFPYSLTPFSDLFATSPILPRKPQHVSHRPFHTPLVHVWHHQLQHPNQIWGEWKSTPHLCGGSEQAPSKLSMVFISWVNY